jgi:hypothetical protein
MTIPRSTTQDLIHPLVACGYNVPWLEKEPIFEPAQIQELTENELKFTYYQTARKVCARCKISLPVRTTSEKAYCSVPCRQIGKK